MTKSFFVRELIYNLPICTLLLHSITITEYYTKDSVSAITRPPYITKGTKNELHEACSNVSPVCFLLLSQAAWFSNI